MAFFKYFLQSYLFFIAKRVQKKHNIETILVIGSHSSEIAREYIYSILNEDINIRRNTSPLNNQFSVPLAILGYPDKSRNLFEWINLSLKSLFLLLFGPINYHSLILNIHTKKLNQFEYWSELVNPSFIVLVNLIDQKDLPNALNKLLSSDTTIIYNQSINLPSIIKSNLPLNYFSFGKAKANLVIEPDKNNFKLFYKEKKANIPKKFRIFIPTEIVGASVATAICKQLELEEIAFRSLKFEFPESFLAKIENKIKFSK